MLSKVPDKFFISLFVLMNMVGIFGYYFGLNYYIKPSSDALLLIFLASSAVLFAWICSIFQPSRRSDAYLKGYVHQRHDLSSLVAVFSLLFVFVYFFTYKDLFILPQLLSGEVIDESSRPDVVGNIPMYWTFTVVLSSFCIPFAVSGFIHQFVFQSKIYSSVWLVLLIFLSTMLGDKSTFLSVIFFIFFIFGRASIFRIFLFFILFLVFYALMKYFYYSADRVMSSFFELDRLLESVLRRVAFINVSSMGVFLDQLIFPGVELPENYNNIKQFVFHRIYGYLPGGAPVPYMISSFGWVNFYLIPFFVFFVSFFIFKFRYLFQKLANSSVYYVVLYLNFYGAIVLVSGSLFDYFFRSFLPIVLVLISSRIVLMRRFCLGIRRSSFLDSGYKRFGSKV